MSPKPYFFHWSYCCVRYGMKHLTTCKISVQSLLVFRLQMKQCQHKHDKLEVLWSACTHTNKHFITKIINKTKPTAIPTNVSVNCFRVRKHSPHQLQDIRETGEVLLGWKHLLGCVLPLQEEIAEWKSSACPKGRSCWPLSAAGFCSSPGFGALPENPSCEMLQSKAAGVNASCHVKAQSAMHGSPSNVTASFEILLQGPMPLRDKGNIWVLLGVTNSCK